MYAQLVRLDATVVRLTRIKSGTNDVGSLMIYYEVDVSAIELLFTSSPGNCLCRVQFIIRMSLITPMIQISLRVIVSYRSITQLNDIIAFHVNFSFT